MFEVRNKTKKQEFVQKEELFYIHERPMREKTHLKGFVFIFVPKTSSLVNMLRSRLG